jgi:glutamyl-tRNA reductase
VNLLVVGVSYRTAPVPVLERVAAAASQKPDLLDRLLARPYVGEAVVLSTCNRVEIYAGVSAFHGGLSDVAAVLADLSGHAPAELAPHLYVHYEGEAVRHAYRVATGLDSMVVGEAQILGQLRDAYTLAADREATGRLLHELMQQALRVGKRAHAETDIDRAGQTVVSTALDAAGAHWGGSVAGRSVLVVGAGAMGALTLATLRRLGAGPARVASRNLERAERLAHQYGATAVPFDDLPAALAGVDLLVSATASPGHVIGAGDVAGSGPLVVLDLAVPRDVDPAVGLLPGVTVIDIAQLAVLARAAGKAVHTESVEEIVATEVAAFLAWLRGKDVAPTVAALRARADEVVTAELARLRQRRADLTDEQRADVAQAVHRVVQRLLHQPTVRVRQLAAGPGGDQYTLLLRELFDLDVPLPTGTPVSTDPEPGATPPATQEDPA